jgi:hypothetical protein
MGNERANRVPGAKAPVQVLPRKNKRKMEIIAETLDAAYARYQRENKKHFKRWAHEFNLVKAWLAAGGRVIPRRYDGLGTYLIQENENILLRYTWCKSHGSNPFCKADNGLIDEGFIIVPNDHVIRNGSLCPDWFMRTRHK